ncbi:AMP-binding protein [Nocardia terpenica]|uniref:AMP-binding protein n=1 Tax=Nocardia terpenica TaxID=455432 RepID=A0A6G9Z5T4_9NOCA|nr:AMP-binding protein [Nocardia terpenica]QIS20707.1 AMP-binding protein [Nocardia terpenica]
MSVSSSVEGSALDCPIGSYPDADQLVREAVRWHFGPDTGSRFWLDRLPKLGFDPIEEIRTFADLAKFPNVVNDLRDVRVEDLIPQGLRSADVYGVYESGGTTGAPKRVLCTHEWMDRWLAFSEQQFRKRGQEPGGNWLGIMPSGPHIFGAALKEQAHRGGGLLFTIDMDPRWVKKRIAGGDLEGAGAYAAHLIEQATYLLETQDIAVMVTTPALLERMAADPHLADLINRKVRYIQWGGMHMDADTRHLFRTEVFPGITLQGGYGSTMVCGGSMERIGLRDDEPCIFDPLGPFIAFNVVDPQTRQPVPYGERGQVVMNLVSKGMFLPNNPERDTALRFEAQPGMPGDAVADVEPLKSFDETTVIEGVY